MKKKRKTYWRVQLVGPLGVLREWDSPVEPTPQKYGPGEPGSFRDRLRDGAQVYVMPAGAHTVLWEEREL